MTTPSKAGQTVAPRQSQSPVRHGLLFGMALCLATAHAETKLASPTFDKDLVWDYGGKLGQEYWGLLNPDFHLCSSGKRQSPIDIVGQQDKGAPKLQFNYQAQILRLINTGHTILINFDRGSELVVGDDRYQLTGIEFHSPSETLINGRNHDMELQLQHRNAIGEMAIVTVLFDRGDENTLLKPILNRLPTARYAEMVYPTIAIDPAQLIPKKSGYFAFDGSLTSPPCSEGVKWFVFLQPNSLSDAQLRQFTAMYPYTARAVQPAWSRPVKQQ